jgi:hypothetical protein
LAKRLLLHDELVLLKTSSPGGLPIFLKVNHQLESRKREIRPFGSEGGAKLSFVPTPISAGPEVTAFLSAEGLGVSTPVPRGVVIAGRYRHKASFSSLHQNLFYLALFAGIVRLFSGLDPIRG